MANEEKQEELVRGSMLPIPWTRIKTKEQLLDLYKAFGVKGSNEKIALIESITRYSEGFSGSTKDDLKDIEKVFLEQHWWNKH